MSLTLKNYETEVVISQNDTESAAFSLQQDTLFIGVNIPAIDNGGVGVEYSVDNGGAYVPIINPATGDDVVILASGSDPAYVDISDYLRSIPRGYNERLLRFTCASQTTADVTLTVSENA